MSWINFKLTLTAIALAFSSPVLAMNFDSIEKEINDASGSDPIRESARSSERIKKARAELALAQKRSQIAQQQQRARYQRQLQTDQKTEAEIARIKAETKKYKKDLAIAEFNQRRSEIALAYAKAKVVRERKNKQNIYQRKVAAERAAASTKASRNN